jgi:hypothetical protein
MADALRLLSYIVLDSEEPGNESDLTMKFSALAFAITSTCFALAVSNCDAAPPSQKPFHAVQCEGAYPGHLQGICTNERDAIYWSFTKVLVKTDIDGRVLHQVEVASHHGDLCFHDGKIFVAVNLGQFNQPAGKADSWVYVYDANTLREHAKHKVPELVHGAGGIAVRDGRFFVVGGLPVGADDNSVYEYDASFAFQKRHALASGYTLMGIQTVAFAADHWWFGCYGNPRVLLKADKSFKLVGKWELDCSLGIVGLPAGQFLVARGSFEKGKGYTGRVEVAVPDDKQGLRTIDPAQTK